METFSQHSQQWRKTKKENSVFLSSGKIVCQTEAYFWGFKGEDVLTHFMLAVGPEANHLSPQSLPGGFPGGSEGKESACSAGDLGSIAGLGRSPGEGILTPVLYSGLENSMDSGVQRGCESRTQLNDFHSKPLALWLYDLVNNIGLLKNKRERYLYKYLI